jgi:hypothetical protein
MKRNLSLLILLFFSIKSISQEFKDLIVTNSNDSIRCTITLLNDYDVYYDHKVKKKIVSDFIQISDLKSFTYNNKKVIPVTPVIDNSKLRKYHEEEKYENWLNFQHQKDENFTSIGYPRSTNLSWEPYDQKSEDPDKDRYVKIYSFDSIYYINLDLYPLRPDYSNPFGRMYTKVQLVKSSDLSTKTLQINAREGFAMAVIWRSNSLFEICGFEKSSGAANIGIVPTIWKFDIVNDTFQKWASERRFSEKELDTIKKRWKEQKMKYPWPLISR